MLLAGLHTKLLSYWPDVLPRIALRNRINGFLLPVCARAYGSPPMPFRYRTNTKDSAGVRHIGRFDAEKDRPSNFATLFAPVQDPAAAQ